MAGQTSWLSPDVMHALGWALIHSVWQCLALAALAAGFMAFSRRPSIRYVIATVALAAALAAPIATFLVLLKPTAPVQAVALSGLARLSPAAPVAINPPDTPATLPTATSAAATNGVTIALVESQRNLLPPYFLSSNILPPNILPWLVAAWLCGVGLFSLRFAGGFLLLEHRCRRQSGDLNLRILALCRELERQLGLNRAIRYLECGWLQAPAVIGWLRPIVLLPVTALTGLTEEQLRAVIAHELAHIRRHDFFVNLLQILVETLLFYHPAIWWLNRRIRAERELCCDEIAVSLIGDRLEYVKALILMEEWEQAPTLAMAANRSPLSERVFHILDRKPFCAGQRMLGLTGSILFLAATLGAANALFGIAFPIPNARAEASIKVVPSSNKIALDHTINPVAPPVPQPSNLAAKDVSPVQSSNGEAGRETIEAFQTAAAAGQAEMRLAQPFALSQLLPKEAPIAPTPVAPNGPPIAPAQPASKPSPAVAVALNDQSGASDLAQPVAAKTLDYAPPGLLNSLPMENVPGSNTMTVTANIDGSPRKLLVETGSWLSILWKSAANELGLPIEHGGFRIADARVSDFALGSMRTGGFYIGVSPDIESAHSGFDGALGTSMMWPNDVDLDFAHKQLNLFSAEQCNEVCIYWMPSKISSVQMRDTQISGLILVPVTLDGHTLVAMLDTGVDQTFLNPYVASKLFGQKSNSIQTAKPGASSGLADAHLNGFSRLTFGGVTVDNPQIVVPHYWFTPIGKMGTTFVLRPDLHQWPYFALGQIGGSATQRAPYSEPGHIRGTANPRRSVPDIVIGMNVLRHTHLYVSFRNQRVFISAAGDGTTLKPPPIAVSWFNVLGPREPR